MKSFSYLDQSKWLELHQSLGYPGSSKGMCTGFGYMRLISFLMDEPFHYEKVLKTIAPYHKNIQQRGEIFKKADTRAKVVITEKGETVVVNEQLLPNNPVRDLIKKKSQTARAEVKKSFPEKTNWQDISIQKQVNEKTQQAVENWMAQFKEESRKNFADYLAVDAYAQSIELLQFVPNRYPEYTEKKLYFDTGPLVAASLILPKKLEQMGGIKRINSFSGNYSENDLKRYFRSLQEVMTESKTTFPIGIILADGGHLLFVGYKNNQWLFSNNLACYEVNDVDLLVSHVLNGFSYQGRRRAIVNSELLVTQSHNAFVSTNVKKWLQSESMQKNLRITPERLQPVADNSTWLLIATFYQHFSCVIKLLKADADPGIIHSNGYNALLVAFWHYDELIIPLIQGYKQVTDEEIEIIKKEAPDILPVLQERQAELENQAALSKLTSTSIKQNDQFRAFSLLQKNKDVRIQPNTDLLSLLINLPEPQIELVKELIVRGVRVQYEDLTAAKNKTCY